MKRNKRYVENLAFLYTFLLASRFASVDPGQNTEMLPIEMATLLSRARYGWVCNNR
jgi:hypothetical protein